jgi:TATA-binding protein-associated factor
MISVGKYGVMKERYDTQVMAGVGGALVALQTLPAKIGPVVKAIMDSIKVRPNFLYIDPLR